MLARQNRLNKTRDFERVFKGGRPYYTKKIGIKALKNKLSVSRFGIVVSTKVAKKATKRNLLKRQLREIIRLRVLKIKQGYDFMIIALPGLSGLNYRELEKEVEGALKKLRVLV